MELSILFFGSTLVLFFIYLLFLLIENVLKFKFCKKIRDWMDQEVKHIYEMFHYMYDIILLKILSTSFFIWLEPIISSTQKKTQRISNFSIEEFKKNEEKNIAKYNKISKHLKKYIAEK